MWDQVWGRVVADASRTSVQLGFVVSAVFLVALTLALVRRAGWSPGRRVVAVLAALGLALFPALTLARRGIELRIPTCERSWGLGLTTAEQVLNLALLVPAGFFAGWALRRVWPVAVAALFLSVGVESVQAVFGLGMCQTGDVVRNVAGAVLGAYEGAVLARWLQGRSRGRTAEGGRVSPGGQDPRAGE